MHFKNINLYLDAQLQFSFYANNTESPNKHGNSVTTFISSSIQVAFFHEHNSCSIPLIFTHLIPKTPGLEIFNMRFTIFVSSKLVQILQNFTNVNFFNNSNLSLQLTSSSICKHEKGRSFHEKLVERTASFLC